MNARNDLDLPTGQRQQDAFDELQVLCAKARCTLDRTDARDRPVRYYTAHNGVPVHHWTLESAAAFIHAHLPKRNPDAA